MSGDEKSLQVDGQALKGKAKALKDSGEARGVKVRPDALKGGVEASKGYGTEQNGDQEAVNNNGGMLTGDGEALKGDVWRLRATRKR